MDATELVALASGLGGALTGFWLGVRVCGPKLQIGWTERHPREIAGDIRAGRLKLADLTDDSKRFVLAEMARMGNGLSAAESAQFLALTGVQNRYVGQDEPHWAHRIGA
jgi:hypothetical protein